MKRKSKLKMKNKCHFIKKYLALNFVALLKMIINLLTELISQ